MNCADTEDGSYASARNRKLLAEPASRAGESEYAAPALSPCQTTAFEFFTDDYLSYRLRCLLDVWLGGHNARAGVHASASGGRSLTLFLPLGTNVPGSIS